MPHPSTSPDMNPIEKCWRWIKQALYRRLHQPTTEVEIRQAITEEWDARMDQQASFKAALLGYCPHAAPWLVYT